MRLVRISIVATAGALALAGPAAAHVDHTVARGDTLWSIAAANNLTTHTVAVYNGLPDDAGVVLGDVIKVPTVAEGSAALSGATPSATPTAPTTSAPAPLGAYIVRPGDTLSGLAVQAGVPIAQMAYVNGLPPDARLLIGTVLKLPAGAPAPPAAVTPAPAARVVPDAAPYPTPVRFTAAQVSALAAPHGVPGSLAAAVAWQESGFNNDLVSTANARGIMQLLPGTWDWVQQYLAPRPLDPASAADNVQAGALYLARLLSETGGDPALAAAAYYQGLQSVRTIGMLPGTRRYVADVLALRARFGG
jgi:soluble lytic murein transglycosylase-like protein